MKTIKAEDLSGTTADMATYDSIAGAKSKKVIKIPVAGYKYMNEDYTADEYNTAEREHYDKLDVFRSEIINAYDSFLDAGIDPDTAIGKVAERFKQDPLYVKGLVAEAQQKLTNEVMTEKELRTKKLLESYGIVPKSETPIEEDEETSDEKEKKKGPKNGVNPFAKKSEKKTDDSEEDDDKEDEEASDKKEKKKGPKKGVNPFAKNKEGKDDSEEESEEDEIDETPEEEVEEKEETHSFKGKGSIVVVVGADHELAQGIAIKLLAPFEGSIEVPKGKYIISFEPEEEIEEESY